jgi:exodeoxyribonuclease V beta subunit
VALQDYLLQLHDRQRAVRHLNLALEGIDEATIFTIHGFCQRITEQHALLSHTRFETELLESLDDLREETLNDALVSELASALPAVLRRFTSRASMLRSAHLVQALHARPGLRILPDVSAQRPVTEAVERFCQAQERARLHFDWDRITQVLSADPGLNRNRVSPRHLPAKMAEMARLLESHADAEPWPEPCVLQYSYLQQCLKNGHERPPEHAFFHACDTLHKAHRDLESILEEEQYALELKCARAAIALEKSRKASLAVQGFDDLLLSVRDFVLPAWPRPRRQSAPALPASPD